MRKFKVYSIVLIVIAGIILSLSNIFQGLERVVLGKYLSRQEHSLDNIVAISVDENNFTQNHLWPWEDNWANYLASFILDLKPSKLILDPDFIKNVSDPESLSGILKSDRVLVPYRDDLKDLHIDFNSHMVYENNRGIFYTFSRYKNMPSVALLLSGQKQDIDGKSRKIYFMPGRASDIVPASSIALFGVLRKEGYRDRNVARLKDSIVFLGVDGKGFKESLSFLNAYIAGDVFSMLDRWFSIYLALFLFSVLYIVMKPLKLKQIAFIFLLAVLGWFVFHKFYFNISRNYIELGPVMTFSILALSIVIMEKKYDYEIEKKEKREAQLARILKEKEVLPHSTLSSDGASVSVTRYKTDNVGGDFYQFLEFSKGELGVILGWVPGAGLDRVRYIMDIVHSWRDFASIYKEPNKVIQVLNNSLFKYAEKAKYATLAYILYDSRKGLLKYVNAGHDPLIFIDKNKNIKILESQEPTPLGIARDVPFKEEELLIKADALVIGYSGGIAKAIYDSGGISEDILKHFNQYLDESSSRLTDDLFSDFLNLCPKKPREEWSLLTLKITV